MVLRLGQVVPAVGCYGGAGQQSGALGFCRGSPVKVDLKGLVRKILAGGVARLRR